MKLIIAEKPSVAAAYAAALGAKNKKDGILLTFSSFFQTFTCLSGAANM